MLVPTKGKSAGLFWKLRSPNKHLTCAIIFVAVISLSGCDSENTKAWKKWRVEAGKVDYRCGMFKDYEFRINRAYLFFWPTYKGRSDWEVKGPPPLSCTAKLETMPMEAYWPGLSPAATHTEESLGNPDRIEINLNSVSTREKWDLILHLEHSFGKEKWRNAPSYQRNKNDLGLDYARGPTWPFPDKLVDYYWVEEPDGRISTFIECHANNPTIEASCTQDQFIPEMNAVLILNYKESKLKNWKEISRDVKGFIKERSYIKRI